MKRSSKPLPSSLTASLAEGSRLADDLEEAIYETCRVFCEVHGHDVERIRFMQGVNYIIITEGVDCAP